MMTSAKTPAAQFANAVDFFFGHNPSNPYWTLVALAMRKVGHLEIVESIPEEDGVLILDENAPFCPQIGLASEMHVVCRPSEPDRIKDILAIFRANEVHMNGGSIFSRTQWERSILLNFASTLIKLDDKWLSDNFDKCFAVLVRRAFANSRLEEFIQPGGLVKVLGHIVETIAPNAKVVYNPFSGMSSYALHIPNGAIYYGEEINSLVAAIANLRLYVKRINGVVYNINAVNEHDYDADLIVSTPPFGLRVRPSDVQFPLERVFTAESLVLRKCLKRSIPAVIVVPRGFNFRKDSASSVRQELIESWNLDMIINLPERIFSNTAIGTTIYVLNPKHGHKGYVRFIDATKTFSNDFHIRILDTESIINTIDNGGDKSKLVSIDAIRENEYNLSPERYFSEDIFVPAGMTLKKMSELGDIIQAPVSTIHGDGKLVNFSVLKNPNPIKIYRPKDFENVEIPMSRHLSLIHSGLLFFGGRGNLGICISTEGETLYTYSDYINFVPDETVVLPQYLLIQFQEEYVREQLPGTTVGCMPIDVFLNIRVLLLPLEAQKRVVEEYQERLIAELGLEVSNLRTQQANEFERNMHVRKHALKQILNEVVPATRRVATFIDSHDGDFRKTDIIAARSNATLNDYTQKLYRNVEKIQRLVSSLTDDVFDDKTNKKIYSKAETFDFSQFMASYSQRKITGDKYRLIFLGESNLYDDEMEIPMDLKPGEKSILSAPTLTAHMSPTEMETVLDNLIANATEHGFTDKSRQDSLYYCVKVLFRNVLDKDRNMLEVRVMNNGAKLPVGMSSDKVFTWGIGRGTGLGSWQVKNIIEHYGGSVEFIQYDDAPDGYNIEYRILIPMS